MDDLPRLGFVPRRLIDRGRNRACAELASLARVLELAVFLRVLAANLVDLYVRHGEPERLCLFEDTAIYWGLARGIGLGAPYVYIEYGDIPHFAIRTPGYPLFLAACQAAFGERTIGVRLVQAILGTLSVYLVYQLARQFTTAGEPDFAGPEPALGVLVRPFRRRFHRGDLSLSDIDFAYHAFGSCVRAASARSAFGLGRTLGCSCTIVAGRSMQTEPCSARERGCSGARPC